MAHRPGTRQGLLTRSFHGPARSSHAASTLLSVSCAVINTQ